MRSENSFTGVCEVFWASFLGSRAEHGGRIIVWLVAVVEFIFTHFIRLINIRCWLVVIINIIVIGVCVLSDSLSTREAKEKCEKNSEVDVDDVLKWHE